MPLEHVINVSISVRVCKIKSHSADVLKFNGDGSHKSPLLHTRRAAVIDMNLPDSKVYVVNMEPIWGLQEPGGAMSAHELCYLGLFLSYLIQESVAKRKFAC